MLKFARYELVLIALFIPHLKYEHTFFALILTLDLTCRVDSPQFGRAVRE